MKNLPSHTYQQVSTERLDQLKTAAGQGPLLILTHDNPDPDALASGLALATLLSRKWNILVRLGYSGLIARAENKAMLEILTPEWEPLEKIANLHDFMVLALVDTQPSAGNNSLPAEYPPRIVFDHHYPFREGLNDVQFLDIRTEFSSTSSIVYQYLEAAGIEPDPVLATAIFYGIQTDTQGLSRGGSPQEQEIYFHLLGKIDRELLSKVVQAGLPREYFQDFSNGLKAAKIFGETVVAYLGPLHRPDFVAEMADSLIRLENTRAVLCLGTHDRVLYLSLRIQTSAGDAGLMIQKIIPTNGSAGGHGTMAGGQIGLQGRSAEKLADQVRISFLEVMGERSAGENLIAQGE